MHLRPLFAEEQILDGDMRLLDVIGNWEQLASEHKNVTISSFRLVFKAELVLKTTHLEIASDLEAIHLLYIQVDTLHHKKTFLA